MNSITFAKTTFRMSEGGNEEFVTALYNGKEHKYRKCSSFDEYGYPKQFSDCAYILKFIICVGDDLRSITSPTPVQSYSVPLVLEKKNVLIKAETGSGKTLAFLMPILFNVSRQVALSIDEDSNDGMCHPRCIVVAPTRELATQVSKKKQDKR